MIDAFGEITIAADISKQGAPGWNAQVTPQLDAGEHYAADEALNSKLRSQGITVRLVAPAARIIKGQSAVVTTGSGGPRAADAARYRLVRESLGRLAAR